MLAVILHNQMKMKVLFLLLLFSVLSCKTANQIENDQFIISNFPSEIEYNKIEFDNSFDNYFFNLQDDINKYSKNDKKLISNFALYRISDRDLKFLIPSGDLKNEVKSFGSNLESQIKNKTFFANSRLDYYPYTMPKTIAEHTKIKIICKKIEGSGFTYNYYSNFHKRQFEILREDYFMEENNRFWHLTIYITDKQNREKIKQKFISVIEKIRFKKKQPNISNNIDLN